ncbi:DUF2283 domain-containing protein [Priestia flexa]|nr:DUF2283 domain-containing protein [Priestia flexa]
MGEIDMDARITYDTDAKLAYLYLFPASASYQIQETEELEVNPSLQLDIDSEGRIVGIELFGMLAEKIAPLSGAEHIYTMHDEMFSFYLSSQEVHATFVFNGIKFCFADADYQDFVGFDVIDSNLYERQLLMQLVKP